MLVGPPDGLLEVAGRLLDTAVELPPLALVESLDRLVVVPDVLPGEQLPCLVAEGGVVLRDREDQGDLECPSGLPVLADDLVEQLAGAGVAVSLLGGHHDQRQRRAVGDLPALVRERDPLQDLWAAS